MLRRCAGRVALVTALILATAVAQFPLAAAAPQPARVQLSTFEALDAGGQVLVRWETSLERGVLTYNLYRQADGQWQLVNSKPLAARGRIAGGRYQVADQGASVSSPNRYRLEVITISGNPQSLITRELTITGRATEEELREPANRPLHGLPSVADSDVDEESTPARRVSVASGGAVDLPNSTARVKMITAAPGMHFVSTANLATLLGQSTTTVQGWINAGTITMSNKGEPVNFVPGQGRISTAADSTLVSGIYFNAQRHLNNYANRNVYWLHGGANAYETWLGGSPTAVDPGSFAAELDVEDDRDPWLSDNLQDPELDFWFLENSQLTANSSSDTYSTSFRVEKLDRTAGTVATLKVRLQGTSDTAQRAEVWLNGVLLGQHDWSGRMPTEAQFTFDATSSAALVESPANNSLQIKALLKTGFSASEFLVDGYNLAYRRYYFATASDASPAPSAMEAGVERDATVSVPNFGASAAEPSAPVILAFDVTDVRNLRLISGLTIDVAPDGTWRGSFNPDPARPNMRFAMIKPSVNNSARVLTANSLSVVRPLPLDLASTANQGSYLLVYPSVLLSSATELAVYRGAEFRTKMVLVDEIYNRFSHGLVTPHAIAEFLQTAYANWSIPPRYVVFVGDGTWDYRNRYGAGRNLIPPLMVNTPYGLVTSDTLFGKVQTDPVPRLILGRLPVRNTTEFAPVFTKIKNYEKQSVPSMKALLIADTPDSAGDFILGINEVEHYLQPTFTSQKVLPPPDATARSQIQSAMNNGVDVVNYIGHGAIDRLGPGAGNYFMRVVQTPLSLDPVVANGTRLPILVVMTCVAGDFGHPSTTSVAEGYVRQANAGAAGAIAPTGLSLDSEAAALNRRVMEFFECNTSRRLGDAFVQSVALYVSGPSRSTPAWIYNVIGDPALKLVTPGL